MENEPFGENSNLKDDIIPKDKKAKVPLWIQFIIVAFILGLATLGVVVAILTLPDKITSQIIFPLLGIINCVYDIKDISIPTNLVNPNFASLSDFDILIDGVKIPNKNNSFLFNETGEHSVIFEIYNP